jgi:hypothetical protein
VSNQETIPERTPLVEGRGVENELQRGQSARTPFLALNRVALVIVPAVVTVVAVVFLAYFLS